MNLSKSNQDMSKILFCVHRTYLLKLSKTTSVVLIVSYSNTTANTKCFNCQ